MTAEHVLETPTPLLAQQGLTAIVVSVNYADMLTISLPALVQRCQRVIVVTERDDWSSEVAERCGATVVYSDRRNNGGLAFDKGALINDGLVQAGEGWTLLVDADCVHSPKLAQLNLDQLQRGVLYGTHMWFCRTRQSWMAFAEAYPAKGWTPRSDWRFKRIRRPNGACQLFWRDGGHRHPEGLKVGVDIAHFRRFKRCRILNDVDLAPVHLLKFRANHRLRQFVAPEHRRAPKFEKPQHAVLSTAVMPRRVEIGPGKKPLKGFLGVDALPRPGVACVARWGIEPLPFATDSVDLIYASHVLEHVPWYKTREALVEAHRILRPGGAIEIWVPDFEVLVRAYLDRRCGDRWRRFNACGDPMLWLNGRIFAYGHETNWHRAVFDESSLKACLGQAGFVVIKRMEGRPRGYDHGVINLGVSGVKPQ